MSKRFNMEFSDKTWKRFQRLQEDLEAVSVISTVRKCLAITDLFIKKVKEGWTIWLKRETSKGETEEQQVLLSDLPDKEG